MEGEWKGEKKRKSSEEKEELFLAFLTIFHDPGVVIYPLSNSRFLVCEVGAK